MKRSIAVVLLVLAAASLPVRGVAVADPEVTVVMRGLDSPRGLTFGPQGALYVAEAGRGGFGSPPEESFCTTTLIPGVTVCFGATGAVSRLWQGRQERVVTGLPSWAMANGNRGIGPHDIAMLGVGSAHVTIGWEADPLLRDRLAAEHPQFPWVAAFGSLVHVPASGEWRFAADIAAYEAANNPDGRRNDDGSPFLDSDPYGLLAVPSGHLVTDAGGNTLLRVGANGDISLIAVFHSRGTTPPRPSFAPLPFDQFTDAVPTSVVIGPDGAYYVSELSGVPFTNARANIYRVVPSDTPQLFLIEDACLSGFKMIIDMDFDADGNLYVLQHATGALQQMGLGVLIRVTPDRTQPDICGQYQAGTRTTVLGGLTKPTSVRVGPDGALYLSHRGVSRGDGPDGGGEVLRVVP